MKYKLILADPAWTYRDKCNSGDRGAGHKYYLMSPEELKRLPVWDLADKDCMLAMWWVPPMPEQALELMKAWGFRLHNMKGFTCGKTYPKQPDKIAIGMGHMTRSNSEDMLFAVRGKMLPRFDASIPQLQIFPRMKHSAKPPQFRDLLVKLVGDVPRIELFAREKAEGWHAWGNECGSDIDFITGCAVSLINNRVESKAVCESNSAIRGRSLIESALDSVS